MRIVIALGGNAMLLRGEGLSAENQRTNIKRAAISIAAVINAGHEVIVTHGNGPQVGLLALEDAKPGGAHFPLDVITAETVGMIGYVIEQELANLFPPTKMFATLLTQIEVDPQDPAFKLPTKPIGQIYSQAKAIEMAAANGWQIAQDGSKFRRVVASPTPRRILETNVIRLLLEHHVTLICAGGGGIPVVPLAGGGHIGVEAVIDKDRASALLATDIGAEALLMLTDVEGVFQNWGQPDQALVSRMTLAEARNQMLPAGSMGPKVEAAAAFIAAGGKLAGIGQMQDALAILTRRAGTRVEP